MLQSKDTFSTKSIRLEFSEKDHKWNNDDLQCEPSYKCNKINEGNGVSVLLSKCAQDFAKITQNMKSRLKSAFHATNIIFEDGRSTTCAQRCREDLEAVLCHRWICVSLEGWSDG